MELTLYLWILATVVVGIATLDPQSKYRKSNLVRGLFLLCLSPVAVGATYVAITSQAYLLLASVVTGLAGFGLVVYNTRSRGQERRRRAAGPPRLAEKLLSLLPYGVVEPKLGDLEELYPRKVKRYGRRYADFWYWVQSGHIAVSTIRASVWKQVGAYIGRLIS